MMKKRRRFKRFRYYRKGDKAMRDLSDKYLALNLMNFYRQNVAITLSSIFARIIGYSMHHIQSHSLCWVQIFIQWCTKSRWPQKLNQQQETEVKRKTFWINRGRLWHDRSWGTICNFHIDSSNMFHLFLLLVFGIWPQFPVIHQCV